MQKSKLALLAFLPALALAACGPKESAPVENAAADVEAVGDNALDAADNAINAADPAFENGFAQTDDAGEGKEGK